ncbi:hypothetical protein [Virgibacillus halodenitrificans]|uniref:hypothetical protein n=1 Tax=Virgibacillus halodenitrificans TaxID=1482 RepID=UPI000EF45B8C|nr:hypothetical protein [Virgibacillus halodenitrificans]
MNIQEEKINEITRELKEKIDNQIPALTGSGIRFGFVKKVNNEFRRYYQLSRKLHLKPLEQVIFSFMKYFRKQAVNTQQGKLRINSKEGQHLIELIKERYDRPIHIVDMLSTFSGTEVGSIHGLGFYKHYYEPVYKQSLGYICIEESLSINQQAHTLIHELVHAKFQDTSFPVGMTKTEYIEKYAVNEVLAESVAFVLSRYLGVPCDEQASKQYILGYMPQALKMRSLDNVVKDVERISSLVLSYLGLDEVYSKAI